MFRPSSILKFLLGFASFALLAALAGWITLVWMTSGGDVYIPDVIGKKLTDALGDLQSNSLYLVLDGEENHAEAPRGVVIAQNPPAGSIRKAYSTVRVILSAGPKRLEMPDLRGYGVRQARLEANELVNGVFTEYFIPHHDYSEGEIVAHIPGPGEVIVPNSGISFLVSVGPPKKRYRMPDVIGLTLKETRGVLQQFSAHLDITVSDRREFGPGIVIDQSPEPGSPLELGNKIQLIVTPQDGNTLVPKRFTWKTPPGLLNKNMLATYTVRGKSEILAEYEVKPSEDITLFVPETGIGLLEIFLDGVVVYSEVR
ncbi:MAG: PASTA domain-containing protein [bacterium]